MNIQALIKESLLYLFEGYCNSGGTEVFSLDGIAKKYQIESDALGRSLKQEGWIKNPNFGPFGFSCQISMSGIQQIRPEYFSGLISEVIVTAGQLNDWIGLMETLSFEPRDFQRAHDLGKVFEASGLADVQYQHSEVYIKLTLQGMDRYRRENDGGFQ